MSDRSDEVTTTREPGSTDDLLEETDRLLSGPESGAEPQSRSTATSPPGDATGDSAADTAESTGLGARVRSRLPTRTGSSRRSLGYYFSPKAFLALAGVLGVGLFVGDLVVPFAGGLLGALAVAFLVGLLTSRRRYLEVALAGVAAGGLSTLFSHPIPAVAGSWQAVFAVGAVVGIVAALAGYYFGRDLRDGLSREI
ncbi:DUF456 domain-containing protein [Natrononativus amylolyticus]|uniref:DUF456 domain-containing protein n=1 Tax=Natrononativus amylolyticus TaxID=2963434 RepID=UPI0020CEAB42|nr:DUF456 domain-containing protein [Natrononativus amylolyticus]